jgi:hypothetical protein
MLASLQLAGLDDPARYLSWGWVSISVPNLVVILIMLLLFVLALVVPFPGDHDDGGAT